MDDRTRAGWRILTWIGIIDQLASARAADALRQIALPLPQFVILNHFSHRPDEPRTVTGIARALQQPQPGVTKTIQKMLEGGLLAAATAPGDGRSKLLRLTPKGAKAHQRAIALLTPAFEAAFAGWEEGDFADLFRRLNPLKTWLDTEGRKPVARPKGTARSPRAPAVRYPA